MITVVVAINVFMVEVGFLERRVIDTHVKWIYFKMAGRTMNLEKLAIRHENYILCRQPKILFILLIYSQISK